MKNIKSMKRFRYSLVIALVLLVILTVPVFASAQAQDVLPVKELTPEMLGGIAGVVLSLAFSHIPKLNVKFAALSPEWKRLIMVGVLLVTSGAIWGLNCGGIISTGVTCDRAGIIQLGSIFIMALVTNQTAYGLTPLPAAVKVAAAESKATSEASAQVKVLKKELDEHDVQSYG